MGAGAQSCAGNGVGWMNMAHFEVICKLFTNTKYSLNVSGDMLLGIDWFGETRVCLNAFHIAVLPPECVNLITIVGTLGLLDCMYYLIMSSFILFPNIIILLLHSFRSRAYMRDKSLGVIQG